MNLQEQFAILVKDHDDMENDLQLAEGETFAYLRSMLPIECFMKEQQEIDYPEFCPCPTNIQH